MLNNLLGLKIDKIDSLMVDNYYTYLKIELGNGQKLEIYADSVIIDDSDEEPTPIIQIDLEP